MDRDKLMRMANSVRTGGKGTVRRYPLLSLVLEHTARAKERSAMEHIVPIVTYIRDKEEIFRAYQHSMILIGCITL